MPPENAIPLYTHNFTRINEYCTGNFTLAEHINGSQLNNTHFPICPDSSRPLNNANIYHGGGYRVQNLGISKPGGDAAMFGAVNNTDIDLIFENPRVEGIQAATLAHTVLSNNRIKVTFYKGGYVNGELAAGMLAHRLTGDNNHIVQVGGDNEIQTVEAVAAAGGSVTLITGNSNHLELQEGSIFVESTNKVGGAAGGSNTRLVGSRNTIIQNGIELTVTGITASSGMANSIESCSENSLIQRGCRIKVNGHSAAAVTQSLTDCSHTTVSQIQCQVEVTGISSATGGFSLGGPSSNNNTLTQADNQITVEATEPDGLATSGLTIAGTVANTTLIQSNNQMNITGAQRTSAFITTDTGRNSQGIRLLLYSGGLRDNKNTPVCPGSANLPVTGLVDIAGYNVDAESCPTELIRLNSTQPDDWHHLQQTFCEYAACTEDTSCHYPNEELLAVVPAGNDALWLVTRQRYPSNPELNRVSPVRISRFLVNDTGTGISPDNSFGAEGVHVLAPSLFNTEPLPDTPPVARIIDQNRLILLYAIPENKEVLLAFFLLSRVTGDKYDTFALCELSGQLVLLSQDTEEGRSYLWMREQADGSDTLVRYPFIISKRFRVPDTAYNLTNTDYPDATVIGLGADFQWLYIARRQDSNVVVERIDLITAQRDNWSATLEDIPVAINSTGLPYRLEPAGNQLYLVPVEEGVLQPEFSATPLAFRVDWPQYGGCAQWVAYSPRSVMLPPRPDDPDHTGIIVGSVLGGGAAIAVAVVAGITLIKTKKVTKNIETLLNAN